jgi:hypothetical protein
VNTEEIITNFIPSKIPLLINLKMRNITALEEREMSGNICSLLRGKMKGVVEEEEK